MNRFKKIILVTGTPGVGKTTVAQRLASKLDALCVGITELVKKENLTTGMDEDRTTLIADTKKVEKRVQKIVDETKKETIIIEGHYAADVKPKETNTVFVLRRAPTELENVLEKRGYTEKKLFENLAAEILDVCLYDAISVCGADKVCEVNVTNRSVDDVVEEIIQVLEKKRECIVGTVDWLGQLEKEGQLEKFLKKI